MRYAIEIAPIAFGLITALFTILGYKRAKRKQREEQGNPPSA